MTDQNQLLREAQTLEQNMRLWVDDAIQHKNEYVPVHRNTLTKMLDLLAALAQPAEGGEHPPHRLCNCAACKPSFVVDTTPPDSHSQAQQPHDMAGMLERGATAWAGVDPQELRAGGRDDDCPNCRGSEFRGFKRGIRCATCNGTGQIDTGHSQAQQPSIAGFPVVIDPTMPPDQIKFVQPSGEVVAWISERDLASLKKKEVWRALLSTFKPACDGEVPLCVAAPKPEPMTWRDIETAPKDGSLFLCWVSAVRYGETDEGQQYQEDVSQADFCSWRDGPSDLPGHGYFDPCCGQIADSQDVTHWMPLPPAPITKDHPHA